MCVCYCSESPASGGCGDRLKSFGNVNVTITRCAASHAWDYSSLGDLATALKGRGWTRAPYVGFGFLCMPPEDSEYVKKHHAFVYTEMPKLASELQVRSLAIANQPCSDTFGFGRLFWGH